jgi:LysM repeat protein
MKKIFFAVLAASLLAFVPARAQDAALEERVNKINGYLQDLQATTEAQRKRMDDMAREIDSLREQLNKPNNAVTSDDLRKLAEQLQEIDRKRAADKELILGEIEKLAKTGAAKPKPKPVDADPTPTVAPNSKGYEYVVQTGDTISAIAKAYRDQGIKVTSDQILAANPGLKATNMKVGQKLFIPAPQP